VAKTTSTGLAVVSQHPPAALTEADSNAADKRYKERLESFRSKDKENLGSILRNNWDKGKFLVELLDEPAKYGNRTVEMFSKDLNISKELAYSYKRFNEKYTLQQVKEASESLTSWHVIYNLLSVSDVETRENLQARVSKENMSADALKASIKSLNKEAKEKAEKEGKPVDKRGGASVSVIFKSTASLCIDVCRKIDEFQSGLQDFYGMENNEQKKEVVVRYKDTIKALQATHKKIEAILEQEKENNKS
jgi:hypothetical protein